MVSYAAVVSKSIQLEGTTLIASGLSCVATDPDFQRRGLATRVVAAATRGIELSDADFGMFTCAPHLAPLYARAGGWTVAPDAVLLGSRDAEALTSTSLGV